MAKDNIPEYWKKAVELLDLNRMLETRIRKVQVITRLPSCSWELDQAIL